MSTTQVGSLMIEMGANVARLQTDMSSAKRVVSSSMREVQAYAEKARDVLGTLGIGLSGAAFVSWVRGAIDAADHLNDLSKATGIAATELSGLKLAAKQSGSDLDAIAASINKLSVNMGKSPEKFRALGITAKEPLEAFKQLSDIMRGIEDPQLRAAVAAEALGKSWVGAAPLLAEGGKKIGEMVETGKRLSGVTDELVGQADDFNDKLAALSGTGGFAMKMVGPLLPLLNKLADDMIAARDATSGLDTGFNPLLETGKAVAVLFGNIGFVIKGVSTEIGGMAAQVAALARGDLNGAAAIGKMMKEDARLAREEFDRWEKSILGVTAATRSIEPEAKRLEDAFWGGPAKRGGRDAKARSFVGGDEEGKKRAADLKRMLEKGRQNELDAYYESGGEEAMREVAAKRERESAEKAWQETERQRKALDGLIRSRQEDAEAQQLEFDLLRESEPIRRARVAMLEAERLGIERNSDAWNQLYDATLRAEEQRDAIRKVNDEIKRGENFARDFGLTFQSAAEDAILEGKKLGDVVQALVRDIARMGLRKGFTEPFGEMVSGWMKNKFNFGGGSSFTPSEGLDFFVPNAAGEVYKSPSLHRYVNGVYDSPRLFAFASGGIFAEDGPEAIMPLRRGADGKLGVEAVGGGSSVVVKIINQTPAKVTTRESVVDGKRELMVLVQDTVAALMSGGAMDGVMRQNFGAGRVGVLRG